MDRGARMQQLGAARASRRDVNRRWRGGAFCQNFGAGRLPGRAYNNVTPPERLRYPTSGGEKPPGIPHLGHLRVGNPTAVETVSCKLQPCRDFSRRTSRVERLSCSILFAAPLVCSSFTDVSHQPYSAVQQSFSSMPAHVRPCLPHQKPFFVSLSSSRQQGLPCFWALRQRK